MSEGAQHGRAIIVSSAQAILFVPQRVPARENNSACPWLHGIGINALIAAGVFRQNSFFYFIEHEQLNSYGVWVVNRLQQAGIVLKTSERIQAHFEQAKR